jgi:mono/diheme cytochrome c family protein
MHAARGRSIVPALLGSCMLAATALASPARAQPVERRPDVQLPDTAAIPAPMVDRGRSLFRAQGQCFVCHGMRLEGGPVAPTLRAHAWKDAANGSLAEIYRVITHGVHNTAMVAHPGGVSDESAVAVAVYVWSVSRGRAKP